MAMGDWAEGPHTAKGPPCGPAHLESLTEVPSAQRVPPAGDRIGKSPEPSRPESAFLRVKACSTD